MSDFSQDIYNFQQYGTYSYKFDTVGNMIFNSSSEDFSQVYVAFPLKNVTLNNSKIDNFYNIDFEEFIPNTNLLEPVKDVEILEKQLSELQAENDNLKIQLDSVIVQGSNGTSTVDSLATKQVILELRKAMGQGRVDSDFSEEFPYTPFRKVINK